MTSGVCKLGGPAQISAAGRVFGASKVEPSTTCSDPASAWAESAMRSAFNRALRLTLPV